MGTKHTVTAFKIIILIVLFRIFSCPLVEAQPPPPNILVLNSYNSDLQWTDDQIQGIKRIFKDSSLNPAFYIEYLDWKNNPTKENLQLLQQLLTSKYSQKKIDVLMATDDVALEFALTYRGEIFSNAPVVFSGVYPETAFRIIGDRGNVTGVYEMMDVEGTLRSMVGFNPKLEEIYLVYDNTESGLAAKQPLERAINRVTPKLAVVYLNDLTYKAIIEKLQTAPDNSAVLIATYSRDVDGVAMELDRYTKLFCENSRVPVYILYDFEMGHGAVGGSLVSGQLQGQNAAELALRILNGEMASNILPITSSHSVATFDYNQLKRYNLPLDKIPDSSVLINNPLSFYEENRTIIKTVLLCFCLLTIYILALIINIKGRKAAETKLKKSNEELASLYEEVLASQDELESQYKELVATQDALSESEKRYKLSVEGANDGLWDWDIQGNEVYLSDRCCELLGQKNNLITDARTYLRVMVPQEEVGDALATLHNHFSGKTTHYVWEQKIITPDGERWILIRGKVLLDMKKKPARMAGSLTDVTERKKNQEAIHYLAYHDTLTSLANRAALNEKLESTFEKSVTANSLGAVIFIDIDNFKVINDMFSHSYGDELLLSVGQRLEQGIGGKGFVARMGGDEFVILLEHIRNRAEAACYAQQIGKLFVTPVVIRDNIFHITVSIGLALFPTDGITREELLKNADLAMYHAKGRGKNQYIFFDQSIEKGAQDKRALENNLRNAVANNELRLWYQPQIQVDTGKIIGFEALLRWYSKDYGLVMPMDFIGIAEETGLIIPIGQQVIKDACHFILALHREGYVNLKVTVNISVVQLVQDDFVRSVEHILNQTGVLPGCLGFEITESILMENIEQHIKKLLLIKEMGIAIYLDDFGTGYSSLKYLKSLPIDVVKIDKSFIDGIPCGRGEKDLTEVIISLAHQIGLKTVAEGVETEEQFKKLEQYHCDAVQGYLFSKPVPEEKVGSLLMRNECLS